jgi:hypothetical protein
MGSGTVLVESARLGLPAHGYEVNPAAYLLGRVYQLCNVTLAERRELLDETERVLAQKRPAVFELPLFSIIARETPPPGNGYEWIKEVHDERVRILIEALIVLLDAAVTGDDAYATKWSAIREIVVSLPFTKTPVLPSLGDARCLPLREGTIDFVLSSPPYINVFNYHHFS